MERVGLIGENRMSNKWMELQQVEMEIAQQLDPASQKMSTAREPDSQIARQTDSLIDR